MNILTNQIDGITTDFIKSFSPLTNEQLNRKPDPKTWSIAQNIEHLIIVNESYYPIIESIRNGSYKLPFISKINIIVSFTGNMILKSISPDRKRKVKTFAIWEPETSQIPSDILKRFESHQQNLKTLINNSNDLISKATIISSPANKNIVYKLETAFEIIIVHERRHYNQAKEVQNKFAGL
ncbi:MAG: DinB family protein [Ignavibacteriaceae bacterium]|jgi:hypothetical protein